MPKASRKDISKPRLRIELLGPLRLVIRRDGHLDQFLELHGVKQQFLLAYLAADKNRTHSRAHLAALFWGDCAEQQARLNLRQALHRLKKTLEAEGIHGLVITPDRVAVDYTTIAVDSHEFLAAAIAGSELERKRAGALYRGRFLDECVIENEQIATWLQTERERYERIAMRLMMTLCQASIDLGDSDRALAYGEKLTAIDPLSEYGHRILMRALARFVGEGAALQHAQGLREKIRRELGCDLEFETETLIAELRSSAKPADAFSGMTGSPCAPTAVVVGDLACPRDFPAGVGAHLGRALRAALIGEGLAVPLATAHGAHRHENAYRLSGALHRYADSVAIRLQLAAEPAGPMVWSGEVERQGPPSDRLYAQLAQRMASLVRSFLRNDGQPGQIPHVQRARDSSQAIERALRLIGRCERHANEVARGLLVAERERRPHDARVLAVLSWALYWAQHCYWVDDRHVTLETAIAYAHQALRASPGEAWAHMMLGFNLSTGGEHAAGRQSLEQALAMQPDNALARLLLGWCLIRSGDSDGAIEQTRMARARSHADSASNIFYGVYGLALLAARKFDQALPELQTAVAPFTEYMGDYNSLISCCGHLGLLDEARRLRAHRDRMIVNRLTLSGVRQNLALFAHRDVFVEGLAKAGVPEV